MIRDVPMVVLAGGDGVGGGVAAVEHWWRHSKFTLPNSLHLNLILFCWRVQGPGNAGNSLKDGLFAGVLRSWEICRMINIILSSHIHAAYNDFIISQQ